MMNELQRILSDITGLSPEAITPDLILGNHLDEIDFADLAMRVEEELGIVIFDENLYSMYTVSDLLAYVEKAEK
ncbi:MAG: acyl carrier protein [Erysipelotrichales bacterium]|nr:acyl carrier protein [Erysipelotrichales bacterium]